MPVRRHPIAVSRATGPLVNIPLDRELIDRLKAIYQDVRADDLRLAEIFYRKLFAAAPDLRPLFRAEPEVQARKLTASLDTIINNLEKPEANAAMLAALGRRHSGYGARPEHYDLVIDLLIDSMRELLGSRAQEQGLREWHVALQLIGRHMLEGAAACGDSRPGPD